MKLNAGRSLIAVVVALAVIIGLAAIFWPGTEKKWVTAEFPRAVSLYEGSDVRILGVSVGTIEEVRPSGTKVVVKMSYDGDFKVPADVKAAVIAPSIVGDRFVQLTPVYTSGAALANNARLGVDRTASPLELDEIFGSLNDLNIALGPQGANAPGEDGIGALTRLLDSTARNFGGQGAQFNTTLKNLGKFTKTLSNNKDELFGTIREVENFVNTLAKNDQTVRQFNDSLAAGSDLLADERDELALALKNLGVAMRQVRGFVADNKTLLTSNIGKLKTLSQTLVKRRDALDEVLKVAPAALNNLALTYNSTTGTLDSRANITETFTQLGEDPASVLCTFVNQAPGGQNACNAITDALGGLGVPRVGVGPDGDVSGKVSIVEPIDLTLGGLVAAK